MVVMDAEPDRLAPLAPPAPLGLRELASEKTNGGRVYRIAGGDKPGVIEPDTSAAQPGA
jgi:hypothetical protein